MSDGLTRGRATGADALPDARRTLLTGFLAPAGADPWPPAAAPPEAFYHGGPNGRPSPPSEEERHARSSLMLELARWRRASEASSSAALDGARSKRFLNIPDAAPRAMERQPRVYRPRVLQIGSGQPLLDTSARDELLERIEQARMQGLDSILRGLEFDVNEGEIVG